MINAATNGPFAARAFHPDLPGPGTTGLLRIASTTVRFESGAFVLELPINGLKIELGGSNQEQIFFSHPSKPQAAIHTADRSILTHPLLANHAPLVAQGKKLQSSRRVALTFCLLFVGGLIAAIMALWLAKDRMVRSAANAVPVEWETTAGETIFTQITALQRPLTNAELEADLRKITTPLLAGIADERYPFEFHIVADETVNAFAIPGGNVVIHTGLLLAADSAEEVAGVLAHEIAHVTKRHGVRNIISSAGLSALLQTFFGDTTTLVGVVANNSAMLMDRKFSREFEREADDAGWNYLLAARIRPVGMITFFEKLLDQERKAGGAAMPGSVMAAVSTHPATQERIDNLRGRLARLPGGDYRAIELDYAAFKERLEMALRQPGRQ